MCTKTLAMIAVSVLSLGTTATSQSFENSCLIAGTPNVASVSLRKVSSGFSRPVAAVFNPLDKTEYLVVEQGGLVRKVKSGVVLPAPVLDLRSVVNSSGNETGLLGLAFHPNFRTNKRVFLNYTTANNPRTVIAEFKMNSAGTIDRASEKVLLEITQPFSNHNGGDIKFGPDGFLYIGTGDGGSANDPQGNGQNLSTLLGKMLRIDVDNGSPYSIPRDNPKFPTAGARKEIFAYGLRNPWRYSFDRVTKKLWAGDVGQNTLEEIDVIEKGGNYGWNTMEGSKCFRSTTCNRNGLILPVHEYPRSEGVSVTGGYVYRGAAIPALVGRYIFADYGSGKIWGLSADLNVKDNKLLIATNYNISSFAEDLDGEIYVLDHRSGSIFLIEKGSQAAGNFPNKLSETGCFASLNPLRPAAGVLGYSVQSQLWSDGAVKSRFISVPSNEKVVADAGGKLDFPDGSLLIKNFFIPVQEATLVQNKIIETRFLVKRPDGFTGYTYRWNDAGSDAEYISGAQHVAVTMATPAGSVDFNYYIPSSGDCNRCHPGASGGAAGFTVSHLNFSVPTSSGLENQLVALANAGVLDISALGDLGQIPNLVDPYDQNLSVNERARSWLHTNCSTCHNPVFGTATGDMDFRSDTDLIRMNICNTIPQHGDLGVDGGKLLVPGNPDKSLSWVRLHSENTSERMPPLASSRRDEQGSELIRTWISSLSSCR